VKGGKKKTENSFSMQGVPGASKKCFSKKRKKKTGRAEVHLGQMGKRCSRHGTRGQNPRSHSQTLQAKKKTKGKQCKKNRTQAKGANTGTLRREEKGKQAREVTQKKHPQKESEKGNTARHQLWSRLCGGEKKKGKWSSTGWGK